MDRPISGRRSPTSRASVSRSLCARVGLRDQRHGHTSSMSSRHSMNCPESLGLQECVPFRLIPLSSSTSTYNLHGITIRTIIHMATVPPFWTLTCRTSPNPFVGSERRGILLLLFVSWTVYGYRTRLRTEYSRGLLPCVLMLQSWLEEFDQSATSSMLESTLDLSSSLSGVQSPKTGSNVPALRPSAETSSMSADLRKPRLSSTVPVLSPLGAVHPYVTDLCDRCSPLIQIISTHTVSRPPTVARE
jgi:hypothetical protein